MRRALIAVCLLFSLAAVADEARAEEVLVLDNGAVLRGEVVRESEGSLVVALTDFQDGARVTVDRRRIVRRFVSIDRSPAAPRTPAGGFDWSASAQPSPPPEKVWSYGGTHRPYEPPVEPPPTGEGFFHRMARVVVMAFPRDPVARLIVGVLVFVAVLVLLGIGMRLAEIDSMGLTRNGLTAALLAVLLAANVYFHTELLRADRAVLLLPAQGAGWMVCAMFLLRCGFARALLLFAFVLFSLAVIVFAAGAVLVTF